MTAHPVLPAEAAPALRYAQFFGSGVRDQLAEDMRHFYRDEDFRYFQERLEFSMVFGEDGTPELRYGLFRVHSGHAAVQWLAARGLSGDAPRRLIEMLGAVTPEFAVGVDHSPGRERVKLYFMRLLQVPEGKSDLERRVREASRSLGVGPRFAPGFDLGQTGIFSVDCHLGTGWRDEKLYHSGFESWREKTRAAMKTLGIRSRFAERFFAFLNDRPSRDAIFCHRYVPGSPGPTGFAIHQTVENGQKSSIDMLLKEFVPDAHAKCWEPLRRVEETGGRILVGHLGISFSLRPPSERFHLYFSVI